MCKKGQSFIETLILALSLMLLIQGTLLIFWIGVNILWMEHQLYQGLLCTAQQKEIEQCKYNTLKQIKKLNSLGTIKSLKIKEFQNEWKGEIQWTFYKKNFYIKQNFILPQ